MHSKGVNYWIAFADIVFMLFITMLIVADDARRDSSRATRELEQARIQVKTLQSQMDRMFGCRDTKTLLQGFSACLTRNFGDRVVSDSPDPCAVTVGEDLIRFIEGGDVPIDGVAAGTVMSCLYHSAASFQKNDPATFQAIKTIHIDGFTDCKGELLANARLGSKRSVQLYSLLLDEIRREADPSAQAVLGKFAVRSFGETRPVAGSRCIQDGEFADDRRVTVSVEMVPQRENIRRVVEVK